MKRLTLLLFLIGLVSIAEAQVPSTISFQGYVTGTGNAPLDGSFSFTFKIFDVATAGTALWTETQTGVTATNGIINVQLGSVTAINLPFDKPYYLSIQKGSDPAFSPRVSLTAAPYSFTSTGVKGIDNVMPSTGNVGVGTTAPTEKLEVAGTIKATAFVGNGAGLTDLPTSSQWSTSGSDISFSTGNVGVGTTAPTEKLEVAGTIKANAFVGNGAGLTGLPSSSQWSTSGSDISFSTGNVGVGTTTPTEKLEVAGTVKATAFIGNGAGLTGLPSTSQWTTSGSTVSYSGGFVGVGGIPSAKFHIQQGGTGIGDGMKFTSSVNTSEDWYFYMDPSDGLTIRDDAADLITFQNATGNVGIGTTSPRSRLDLATSTSEGSIFGLDQLVGFNDLRFYTDNLGTTPALFINAARNVGVGTTTPNAALQFGNVIANRRMVLWEDANNDHQYYGFGINGNTLRYQISTTGASHIFYAGASTSTSVELVRITGSGRLGIGTTAPVSRLHVVDPGAQTGSMHVGGTGANGSAKLINFGDGDFVHIGENGSDDRLEIKGGVIDMLSSSVRVNGTLVHSSDRRLKKDISNIPYGLSEILALKPMTYYWKDKEQEHKSFGLIAQDVQPIIKEIVHQFDPENDYLSVSYIELVPVLIKATQEQQEQIEELKLMIAALKAEVKGTMTSKAETKAIEAVKGEKE